MIPYNYTQKQVQLSGTEGTCLRKGIPRYHWANRIWQAPKKGRALADPAFVHFREPLHRNAAAREFSAARQSQVRLSSMGRI